MSNRRRPRTDEALALGVEGTDYGYRQLLHAGVLLSDNTVIEGFAMREPELVVPWFRNALIESFLANARRIGWFLYKAKAGDAYAGDYLTPEPWQGWLAADPIIHLVSDVLSHSKYIEKPPPYKWRALATPLVDGMNAFTDRLESARSQWTPPFVALKAHAALLLPRIRDGEA